MSSSFNWTALVVAIGATILFWTISSTSSPFTRSFPRLRNKRICLLIAHPDDEAMFFSPTVLALTKPELGNHLKILCLSTGDADGLGETRRKELEKSALLLGVRDRSDVFVLDDPTRFPDSMSTIWSPDHITSLLASAFAPDLAATLNGSAKKNPSKAPTSTIDVLLTFDQHGVSNHPNHRSLYHGAVHFLRTMMAGKDGFACPVTMYTLTSTSMLRKYVGVLDAPLTMVMGVVGNLVNGFRGKKGNARAGTGTGAGAGAYQPARLIYVSGVGEWLTAQSAMVMGHQSQMVWFRWGWITIGRYMTVNDLKREKI
ncbi:N-acetylglucosaminyl-phosphatidylinositol de-N-acetylase [Penicillium oxalicum]|uniref:N-acetylglucosaminyl-phosphatidylinositol de-N-acetylase n=1 Tax=Penicillium oxalicum TaxID=69781 RepID=UPI0020B710E9|nr:N-acetylglucosaminyl-phosphatidylinositol de-N-acetylase [Penicillium oxalicum]KAI2789874.1 N-acetylglucosaminyl-phosphatidylinositol de-N-acetylase [Penicillium oxalicum]